jgi:hypothetical protein
MYIYIYTCTYTCLTDKVCVSMSPFTRSLKIFFFPLLNNHLSRHWFWVSLRRNRIRRWSHKICVFLVTLGYPKIWGIRRWVLNVIIINNVSLLPLLFLPPWSQVFERKKTGLKIDLSGLRPGLRYRSRGPLWPKTRSWPVFFCTPWPETLPVRGFSYD